MGECAYCARAWGSESVRYICEEGFQKGRDTAVGLKHEQLQMPAADGPRDDQTLLAGALTDERGTIIVANGMGIEGASERLSNRLAASVEGRVGD